MTSHELDEDKLRTLDGWAKGLRTDARAEVAAAGRAIEMLIEEIERLHVLLWDARLYPGDAVGEARQAAVDRAAEAPTDEEAEEGEADVPELLFRDRLAFAWRRLKDPQSEA